jgi:predicted MFS family arabinose efflux permease
MLAEKMNPLERRAVASLAAVMSLRLIGLFMILPVFTLYAQHLAYATPFLIGLSVGIYGLTQGLFQLPFGALSDRWGRKPIIALGLIIFASGSLIAALSHSIYFILLGRALQGAGAIGSTVTAMLADLTRETQRTKAMAINGMCIGTSFSLAMILGPLFASKVDIAGLFWLALVFSFLALIILWRLAPTPTHTYYHADTESDPKYFSKLLKNPQLLRLNFSICALHAIFTASFVVIPIALHTYAGLTIDRQWLFYIPTLVLAFIFSLVCIGIAESKRLVKPFLLGGVVLLLAAELALYFGTGQFYLSAVALFLFFTAFTLLEAFLPSWVSRIAPKNRKGTALGLFSCAQFLGIFIGGSAGGWLYGAFGLTTVYLFCALISLIWLGLAFGLTNPHHQS